jgi:hypothetical protein
MKRMFAFDPVPYAAQFAARDYVHIPGGLSEAFYEVARQQVEHNLQTGLMANFHIGDKQQALYEFPDADYLREFLAMVGAVSGLDADRLVISERHIKAYDKDAEPLPLAHKDRFATEVAVGLAIRVPKGSTLVLYPNDERDVNPFNTSTELRASLRPETLPETRLRNAKRVEIQDSARDIMMFRGNAIWHLREHPAGTVMLYFKLNAFHSDPLGEDPRTGEFQAQTRALAASNGEQFVQTVPVLGRRVDYVQRRYNRAWQEVVGVVLWGQRHFTIDDQEYRALQLLDGKRTVREVVRAVSGGLDDTLVKRLRRLAERGVVDLLPAAVEAERPVKKKGDSRRLQLVG